MNLYLTLIGIISTISCVLIIICINSKSAQPSSTPIDGSKSPLPYKGLTDSQKSQILLIVCGIFFLSLITTNVKTSKFSVMFHNIMASFSDQVSHEQVTDLREVFYGLKGSCQFKENTKENYPYLFGYLKETQMEKKLMDRLYHKNFEEFSSDSHKDIELNETQYQKNRLVLLRSRQQEMGVELILPLLSQNICKLSKNQVPTIYLDLNQKVQTEQDLMNLLKVGSYDTLKQSICKLNGIEISRQVQRIGSYMVEKQTYTVVDPKKTLYQKVHLIINNYHHLNDLLIFSSDIILSQDYKHDKSSEEPIAPPMSLKPEYQLFIDKLLNQLVENCQINLILHTSKQQEISRFYQNWKFFRTQTNPAITEKSSTSLDDFPFDVKVWKGITKFQVFELIRDIIQASSAIKQNESSVWKLFEKSFGKVVNPAIKLPVQTDSSLYTTNEEQISFSQLEKFFAKLSSETQKDKNDQKSAVKKISRSADLKRYIAEYYGIDSSYEIIKTLSNTKQGHKQVSIGTLKKKITLEEIKILEQKGLIRINGGKVFLVE